MPIALMRWSSLSRSSLFERCVQAQYGRSHAYWIPRHTVICRGDAPKFVATGLANAVENEVLFAAAAFVFMTYFVQQTGVMDKLIAILSSALGRCLVVLHWWIPWHRVPWELWPEVLYR